MLFGYVRVSTKSQNPNLQTDAFLKEGGVKEKNIYRDVSSGTKADKIKTCFVQVPCDTGEEEPPGIERCLLLPITCTLEVFRLKYGLPLEAVLLSNIASYRECFLTDSIPFSQDDLET